MCYQPIQVKSTEKSQLLMHSSMQYMLVPCRQCLECRQSRAREWALRCHFELQNHKESSFLTLTYEKSPVVLIKKDIQDFMKRLRKSIEPKKIKYFLCGEYGDKKRRPHFHVILFGHDFDDKYSIGVSDRGHPLFESETLNKIWGKGICTIQDVNYQTIAYTALYSSPARKSLPKHLQNNPEFNLMSQGLGVKNILKDLDRFLPTDTIYIEGVAHSIPKAVLNKSNLSEIDKNIIMRARYKKSKHFEALEGAQYKKNKYDKRDYFDYIQERKRFVAENKQKRFTKVL